MPDIISELKTYGVEVDLSDPVAIATEVKAEYQLSLSEPKGSYEAVIVAVAHQQYSVLDESYFRSLLKNDGELIDLKGIYRNKMNSLKYWSL